MGHSRVGLTTGTVSSHVFKDETRVLYSVLISRPAKLQAVGVPKSDWFVPGGYSIRDIIVSTVASALRGLILYFVSIFWPAEDSSISLNCHKGFIPIQSVDQNRLTPEHKGFWFEACLREWHHEY